MNPGWTRRDFVRRSAVGASALFVPGMLGRTAPSATISAASFSSLQEAIDAAVSKQKTLVVAETHVLKEGVTIPSGLRLNIAAGGHIVRAFSTTSEMESALLRNPVAGKKVEDVVIWGAGKLGAADLSYSGTIIGLYGDRIHITGITVDGYVGRALQIGGDHNRVTSFHAINSNGEHGAGGIRMVGGTDFVARGCHVDSGDDSFQFVPVGAPALPWFDQSISNAAYVDCTGRSRAARLLVVGLVERGAAPGGMKASIENVSFTRCTGYGGRFGIVVKNQDSSGDIAGVTFTDCAVDMSHAQRVQNQDVIVDRDLGFEHVGHVRGVSFNGLTVRNPIGRSAVIGLFGAVESISFTDLDLRSGTSSGIPVDVTGGRSVHIRNGVIAGAGTAGQAVVVGGVKTDVTDLQITGTRFADLPSNALAVNLNNVQGALVSGIEVDPAPGAQNVHVARIGQPASRCVLEHIDVTKLNSSSPFIDQASDKSTVIRDCPGYTRRR